MWTHLLIALCKILALLTATSESQTRGELLPVGFSLTFGNRKYEIFKAEKIFFETGPRQMESCPHSNTPRAGRERGCYPQGFPFSYSSFLTKKNVFS